MAVVHYKFKNSIEYDSITFDGLGISLSDLKKSIMAKKRIRPEDSDLKVVNAQTGEVYSSANVMIPKNTSLTVSRIPAPTSNYGVEKISAQEKAMKWAAFRQETRAAIREAEVGESGFNSEKLKKSGDLLNAPMSEMDKIAQMIKQSTKEFDPSNYSYKVMTGTPGASYVCFKCGKAGHFIQNCPNVPSDSPAVTADMRIKKPTGIPLEHMLIVSEALPGTYKTHSGHYAVPKIDAVAYAQGKKEKPPFLPETKKPVILKKPVPKELKCPLCGDLARDAVVIPCCGISYCDECIRNKLLETDDHVCPSCDSMDVSPDGLIANQMLRRAVTNFQNETGYTKIAQNAVAKAMAINAAKAQTKVIPRGPSVLDFKPPKEESPPPPPPPPKPKPATTSPALKPAQSVPMPDVKTVEPPTPTQDEPQTSIVPPVVVENTSTFQTAGQGESVSTIVGLRSGLAGPQRPALTSGFNQFYSAPAVSSMAITVPYPVPSYPPPTLPPPPFLPPHAAGALPPPIPPVIPPVVPPLIQPAPTRPSVAVPPLNIPKPLSEKEFLEEKQRLIKEEMLNDPILEFQRELDRREKKAPISKSKSRSRTRSRTKSRSRSRSRTRSRSRPLYRSRTRSRSRGRSFSASPRRFSQRRSRTPRRSLSPRRSRSLRRSLSKRRSWTPRRSRSPRRSFTPRRSRSPFNRSRSPRRSYSPRRSRSPKRSRSPYFRRSYSRSPIRRRSFSRSPYRKRSYSPSPRRSPRRRSRSRGRYSPARRSRSPFRKSRSRSRGFTRRSLSRGVSPKRKFSPNRRRSPFRPKKSPPKGNKEKSFKAKSPKRDKSPVKNDTSSIPTVTPSTNKDTAERKPSDQHRASIPPRKGPGHSNSKSNLVVINVVDQPVVDQTKNVADTKIDSENKQIPQTEENKPSTENKVEEKENEMPNLGKSAEEKNEIKEEKDDDQQKNSERSITKDENQKENRRKDSESNKDKEKEQRVDNKSKSRRSRSRSRERTSGSQKSSRPRRRRSADKKKSPSDSPSPPRVKAPLVLAKDSYNYRDRGPGGRGRGRGGARRDGRDHFGDRDRGPDYRGQEFIGYGRGEPPYRPPIEPDFRIPAPGHHDFRSGPPPPHPDFRGQPGFQPDPHGPPPLLDFHRRNSPGFPPNFNFAYPPRDPREDPNYQGQVGDEDIRKFEQYKQMYDMYYNRSYGFPPGPSQLPSGQTPPQGPPPAPPGTAPIPIQNPASYDRGYAPKRHRSRSPGKAVDSRRDRRDYDRDRHRERPRDSDNRDRRSPDREHSRRSRDYDRNRRSSERDRRSPVRERSSERDRREKDGAKENRKIEKNEKYEKDSSPDTKDKESAEKVNKKEKKAKKRKDKEGVEKKKKKKKEKIKEKGRKEKVTVEEDDSSADEEPVTKKKSRKAESSDSTESETEKTEHERNLSNVTQSESSDHEAESQKKIISEDNTGANEENIKNKDQDTAVSSSVTETVNQNVESGDETSGNEALVNKDNKRRSLKRTKPDKADDEEEVEVSESEVNVKKPKLEVDNDSGEGMDVSGQKSPQAGSELDDIPQPEHELMLDPPEVSKWEKEDDPYDLSPEPTKVKEKWKPEKPTLLPRSVIEKAEKAFSQKVMKPTTIASAVSLPRPKVEPKKEIKSPVKEDVKKFEIQKKREKSPGSEPKRRVFMGSDRPKDERHVQSKPTSVKITVSSSKDDDRRKVSTDSVDLRDKIRRKTKDEDTHNKGHSDERKVKQDRRDSREYKRQDSHGSKDSKNRQHSRKESVNDESKFVPDYDDDESDSDRYSEDSSSDSSSEEEAVRRKKHRKNKHKKERKKKKEKKEKKKKKHKEKVKEGKKATAVK